jgi:hypothetical protein
MDGNFFGRVRVIQRLSMVTPFVRNSVHGPYIAAGLRNRPFADGATAAPSVPYKTGRRV